MKRTILFAIGDVNFEGAILQELNKSGGYTYESAGFTVTKSNVLNMVKEKKPNILILRDDLQGQEDTLTIVREVKDAVSDIRIIILTKERAVGDSFLAGLVTYGIYDFISTRMLRVQDVAMLVLRPNKYADISKYIPVIKVKEDGEMAFDTKVIVENSETLDDINRKKSINENIKPLERLNTADPAFNELNDLNNAPTGRIIGGSLLQRGVENSLMGSKMLTPLTPFSPLTKPKGDYRSNEQIANETSSITEKTKEKLQDIKEMIEEINEKAVTEKINEANKHISINENEKVLRPFGVTTVKEQVLEKQQEDIAKDKNYKMIQELKQLIKDEVLDEAKKSQDLLEKQLSAMAKGITESISEIIKSNNSKIAERINDFEGKITELQGEMKKRTVATFVNDDIQVTNIPKQVDTVIEDKKEDVKIEKEADDVSTEQLPEPVLEPESKETSLLESLLEEEIVEETDKNVVDDKVEKALEVNLFKETPHKEVKVKPIKKLLLKFNDLADIKEFHVVRSTYSTSILPVTLACLYREKGKSVLIVDLLGKYSSLSPLLRDGKFLNANNEPLDNIDYTTVDDIKHKDKYDVVIYDRIIEDKVYTGKVLLLVKQDSIHLDYLKDTYPTFMKQEKVAVLEYYQKGFLSSKTAQRILECKVVRLNNVFQNIKGANIDILRLPLAVQFFEQYGDIINCLNANHNL